MMKAPLNQSLSNIKQVTKLPIDVGKVESMLNISDKNDYNCWGFTAYVLKMLDSLKWLEYYDMENLLKAHTRKIKKPKVGDIVVCREVDNERLTHTALICEYDDSYKDFKVIHKAGTWELDVDYVDDLTLGKFECYGVVSEYRRVKKI